MSYKSSLENLRRQISVEQPEEEVRPAIRSPRIQKTEDTRSSEDILTVSADWIRQVKESSERAKQAGKKASGEDDRKEASFAEALEDTVSKKLEEKESLIKRPSLKAELDTEGYEGVEDSGNYTPSTGSGSGYGDIDTATIEKLIRREAYVRGIDPDIAVKVFHSEGKGAYQSQVARSGEGSDGGKEASYGPYQLYTGGGLGNEYEKVTGRKLVNDNNLEGITTQVRFSLDKAVEQGWSPWYGAAKVGVNKRDGLAKAKVAGNWKNG